MHIIRLYIFSVSNIRSFLDKPEAQNVNCMAALRGLEELSARYFRDQTRFKCITLWMCWKSFLL